MKLLLHICCAPCSIMCIEKLREKNIDITGFWYNPNIHPFIEYKSRRDCLENYSNTINLKVIYKDEYGLKSFCKKTIVNLDNRCLYCYSVRIKELAKYAKEYGYDAISTTLLYSPYQKHEELKSICEKISKEYGVEFYYEDFRPYFREGQEKARSLGFYMQKYCGCIFSEEERYLKKIEKDNIKFNLLTSDVIKEIK